MCLADFGLAKVITESGATSSTLIGGTPASMGFDLCQNEFTSLIMP